MTRSLRSAIGCALALAAFSAFASSAAADDFCVGAASSSCDQTFSFDETGFTDALQAYAASGPGTDKILIAPGTIEMGASHLIEDTAGELTIRGAGSGKTTLLFPNPTGWLIYAIFNNDSTIADLKIESPGSTPGERSAIVLLGGNLEDVYVYMDPGANTNAFTFQEGESRCIGCRAKVSGASATGFRAEANADVYIEGSKAEVYDADAEVHTRGVSLLSESASVEIEDTLLKGFNRGVFQNLGQFRARDSIIDLGDQDEARGFSLEPHSTVNGDYFTLMDAVTVYGTGDSQSGIELQTNTDGTGGIEVEADNTLFWLAGAETDELFCNSSTDPEQVNVLFMIDYSLAPDVTDNNCNIDAENMVNGTATFVDAASGDFRPAPGSVVIDAGDPLSADARTDFYGGARYVNGADFNFAGDIDLGAAEYQNYKPNKPTVSATPTTVTVGSPVTFSASGTDPNNQPLTFSWEFGEGGSAAGATVTRTYAVPGTYKAKTIASDGELSHASAWVEITVVEAPPAPAIVLGKPTGKFKYGKKKPKPFAIGTATSKLRIPVTTNFAGEVTLTLAKVKGGWTSGKKCVSKKPKKGKPKRCDLPLKGSQKLTLPAGQSFLTFGGKWGRSALPTGRYKLTVTGLGTKHETQMNAVRNLR